MLLTYPKKAGSKLSEHFTSTEFDCPCDQCSSTLVDGDLITRLENLRKATGPLHVNSGYRCAHYQDVLRLRGYETASGVSQHQLGKAADIMPEGNPLSGVQLEDEARKAGFKAVGVGHSWIHVDLRDDKDRRWVYTKR